MTRQLYPHCRIVSAYEDKALGLSENGEVFKNIANFTFSQFVDKIIEDGERGYGINEHWIPYYRHCNFCRIKYDVVGRTENFEEYLDFIMKRANLSNFILPSTSGVRLHPSGIQRSAKRESFKKRDKTSNYFSLLSESQRNKLYQMYKIDFAIFGYDANKFL